MGRGPLAGFGKQVVRESGQPLRTLANGANLDLTEVTADGRPDKRGMIGREADEDTYDFWMHVGGVQEDVERRGYGC